MSARIRVVITEQSQGSKIFLNDVEIVGGIGEVVRIVEPNAPKRIVERTDG